MRNHAIHQFVKGLLLLAAAAAAGYFITRYGFSSETYAGVGAYMASCLPFGWRWASRIITAVSLYGVGIKAVLSVVLGIFAAPICLLVDLVHIFTAGKEVTA